MKPFNWKCPFCGYKTTITEPNYQLTKDFWSIAPTGKPGYSSYSFLVASGIKCPNDECGQVTVNVSYVYAKPASTGSVPDYDAVIKAIQLLPESTAKSQPEFIPAPIREDYYEACRIKTLSPKASATLSRRCLQGVIRDFWKIVKPRLKDEIDALQSVVDSDLWDAIHAVRELGNIGAHMEKDVNIIVEVDPNEAQTLIDLLELLFEETYVAREQRKQRTSAVIQVAQSKKAAPP